VEEQDIGHCTADAKSWKPPTHGLAYFKKQEDCKCTYDVTLCSMCVMFTPPRIS